MNKTIISRAVGGILLILALLSYLGKGLSADFILSFVIGLIFLLMPLKYHEKNNTALQKSYHLNLNFLFVVFFEIIFWVLFAVTALTTKQYLEKYVVDYLGPVKTDSASLISLEVINQAQNLINTFFVKSGLVLIIFALAIFLIYTLTASLIWAFVKQKKINLELFKQFLKSNLVWWILWGILFVAVIPGRDQELMQYLIVLFIIFYAHFSNVFFNTATKMLKLKQTFTTTLSTAIRLNEFALPYAVILVIYLIIAQLSLIGNEWIDMIQFILLIGFLPAWIKLYFARILENM